MDGNHRHTFTTAEQLVARYHLHQLSARCFKVLIAAVVYDARHSLCYHGDGSPHH